MVHQLIMVFLYMSLLLLISSQAEWFFWWVTGHYSYQLVEPLKNLSVSQLKMLLDLRGIYYSSIIEKSEIVDLVTQSGNVYYSELYNSIKETKGPEEIYYKETFYDRVFEEQEAIWLVEIIPGSAEYLNHRLISEQTWKLLLPKLGAIGIGSAIFHCQYNKRFCEYYGWEMPQLLLVAPGNPLNKNNTADKVLKSRGQQFVVESCTYSSLSAVLGWIHNLLISKVNQVTGLSELENKWLNISYIKRHKVPHIVYISELISPPLLLATLGLKFSSRFKFSWLSVQKDEKIEVKKLLGKNKLQHPPVIAIITNSEASSYGSKKGEILTHKALDSYLRLLQPNSNDLFILTVILTNFIILVDVFNIQRSTWKHIVRTVLRIPVYNVLVFLMWLALYSLQTVPLLKPFHTFIKTNSVLDSSVAGVLSYHLILLKEFPLIPVIALFALAIIITIYNKYFANIEPQDNEEHESDWWYLFPLDSYLVNVLFRPMASLSRPRPAQDLELEEGMELLIERLATPDLWLHPVVPSDYIKDLSVWRYDGWGNEEDLKSESETDFDSFSETENILETCTCCFSVDCHLCHLWITIKKVYLCHRCAVLKRRLERYCHKYKQSKDLTSQNWIYEKLIKVCEECVKVQKHQDVKELSHNNNLGNKKGKLSNWFLSSQKLKTLEWKAPARAIESRVCAICLGKYAWSAVLCGLPCGHNYHHTCIIEWLSKDNHHCPVCRWPSYIVKNY